MIRTVSVASAGFVLIMLSAGAWAQEAINSPVGLWKNIDDESGKSKALIRITESNGVLTGTIEKLFREPNEDQSPKCIKCDGANKDQPIMGMVILTGLKKDPDAKDQVEYSGGTILDPNNGNVYKSKLKVDKDGKKLNVRGYIGFSWLGRSQVWLREQ
jgi:uncharacterized protein (DUF2147 family)